MEFFTKKLGSCFGNIRNLSILVTVLLLWAVSYSLNNAIHEGCNEVSGKFSFLREGCINEGVRNAEIINTVFPALFLVILCVCIVLSIIKHKY